MPPHEPFSHDQAVKNLIKDYPEEALEFLASDVVAAHGRPVEVEFLDTAVAKDDAAEPGPGPSTSLRTGLSLPKARSSDAPAWRSCSDLPPAVPAPIGLPTIPLPRAPPPGWERSRLPWREYPDAGRGSARAGFPRRTAPPHPRWK